jgi:hypothetical protein
MGKRSWQQRVQVSCRPCRLQLPHWTLPAPHPICTWPHMFLSCRQALQELFTRNPKMLSALLFCYDYQQEVDRRALASVCSAGASSAAAGK